MPAMYENPVRFLKELSAKVNQGWVVLEFDYNKERVVVKRDDDLQKAVVKRGRLEWTDLTRRESDIIRGTDRFFIV